MSQHHSSHSAEHEMRTASTSVLLKKAEDIVTRNTSHSTFFRANHESALPVFSRDGTSICVTYYKLQFLSVKKEEFELIV